MACEDCGTYLPCVKNGLCRECNYELKYCYNECKEPCREKAEQKELFDKWKPGWDD